MKKMSFVVFAILFFTVASGASAMQQSDVVLRADLHLQQTGDDPMGTGSGGLMGSAFFWVAQYGNNRVLKIIGVVTPQGTLDPQHRPSQGDVFLGLFPRGKPDTAAERSVSLKDFRHIGSFTPPQSNRRVTLFFNKLKLPDSVDQDGNDRLELRLILKPNVRGLNQACKEAPVCGVATKILSIPIDPREIPDADGKTFTQAPAPGDPLS